MWLEEREKWVQRTFQWGFAIPTDYANDWHCKYRVLTNDMLIGGVKPTEKIIVDFVMHGFDDYVYVILQPKGSINDVDISLQNSGDAQQIH